MATVTVNQIAWDFSNIQFSWDIMQQIGSNQSRALVTNIPLGPAIREINYNAGKIEFDDMMGASRLPQDTTDGMGVFDGNDLTLEKYGSDLLIDIINSIQGQGWATVRHTIGVTFYKTGVTPTRTDTLFLARLNAIDNNFKSGKDTAAVKYTLKPYRVYLNGKDPFGGTLAQPNGTP